jgi:5-epi-alpha-selinene synthase
MHPMLDVKFPALYCPFPSAINQYAEAAGKHSLKWARSFNLVIDESAYQSFRATKFHVLAARCYPNACLEALEVLSDFLVWIFIGDDQFEEAGTRKQTELLQEVHARLLDILKGAELTDFDTSAQIALRDIRPRLHQLPHATSELMLRFVKNMTAHLEGVLCEALNHSQGIVPDLATYMKIRSFTSAVFACCDLIQIVDRIALPPEVIEHPIVKRLELAANNVSAWSNDILSLEREVGEGKTHNLVVVLQHEYQIPVQEAVERAAEIHDAEVRTFIELSVQLPSFGAQIDAELQRYISGLRFFMRGCLDWYLETGRYCLTETGEILEIRD